MKLEKKDFLIIYQTILRNIGIFITISLATKNFKYTNMGINVLSKSLITLSFTVISLLLNIKLLILVYNNEENISEEDRYIIIIPYITLILILIFIVKIIANILLKFKLKRKK